MRNKKHILSKTRKRIFKLENGGTCFTLRSKKQEFLITANHCVEQYNPKEGVEIEVDGNFKRFFPRLIGVDMVQDIAVFESPKLSNKRGLSLADRYHPFNLGVDVNLVSNRGVDSGCLSQIASPYLRKNFNIDGFIIEGKSEGGDSGSPVLYQKKGGCEKVFGVLTNRLLVFGRDLYLAGRISKVMEDVHNSLKTKRE